MSKSDELRRVWFFYLGELTFLLKHLPSAPLNDVGISPRQERSSWGFIWPFVAHKMSLCVGFSTSQGARATQSRELPRDPDAWRLVTRETSEALQKCWFSSFRETSLWGPHEVCFFSSGSILYFHHSRTFRDRRVVAERSWTSLKKSKMI